VNSPNTVKYQNNVSFVDGSATVNWNTMTEITGDDDDNDDDLTPDIDSALNGTWADSMGLISMTVTGSGITWGGSIGSSLNTTTDGFQGTGYSFVWVASNGSISYKYSYMGGTPITMEVYTYTISGNQLELKASGMTFATLTKQ
jgi:hypothetical protein